LDKFDVVSAWISNVAYSHSQSEKTGTLYKTCLHSFCEFVGKSPEEILSEYESCEDEKIYRRKYAQYLRAYISHLSGISPSLSPNTIHMRVASVKSFFKYSDIPLGFVPKSKQRVVYHNRDITREETEAIIKISHPREKAFFSIMAQSGLRVETLCNLKLENIEPDFSKGVVPCKISVPQEIAKGKYRAYFTFMGEESVRYLKAYLHTRPNLSSDSYLFISKSREGDPASAVSISQIFRETIQHLRSKGDLDYKIRSNGKPSELRLYNLRKFFRKFANQAGFEYVQFWMGHIVRTGDEENYRPTDPEHHRTLYAEKAMPHLRLGSPTPTEVYKDIEKVKTLESQVEAMKHQIEELSKENNELMQKDDARYEELFKMMMELSKDKESETLKKYTNLVLGKKKEEKK
jgi:integrase